MAKVLEEFTFECPDLPVPINTCGDVFFPIISIA